MMKVSLSARRTFVSGFALLLMAPLLSALPIDGSFSLNGSGIAQNGANLGVSTSITMQLTLVLNNGVGDFAPIALNSNFGTATLDLSSLANLATNFALSNATYGSFSATTAQIIQQSGSFLDVYFEGTYTPGPGLAPGLDPSPASARVSVNQSGQSLSSAITLNSPPVAVPEPSTVAFLTSGLGLLALGSVRRNREKR